MMVPLDYAITLTQEIESLNAQLDEELGFLPKDPEVQKALATGGGNLSRGVDEWARRH